MKFLKKLFKPKMNDVEIGFTVASTKSYSYDINGNLMSDEEVEKMLELSRKQQEEREKQRIEWQNKIDKLKSIRNEPSEWLNNYLESIRKTYENYSYEIISDLYFQLMNDQRESEKNKDYKKVYAKASGTLPLLEKFIQGENKEMGWFRIKTIPAIEFCMKYTSIMGLVGGFKNVQEIVNYFPEIKLLYEGQLSEYEILLDLSKKIRKLVKTNPEVLQRTLKKELPDYEPKLITKSCSWMEKFGVLKREKIKNTYKLTLTY